MQEKQRPVGISPDGARLTTRGERAMILLLIISVPVCIELAGWIVDAAFATQLLNQPQVCEADDIS